MPSILRNTNRGEVRDWIDARSGGIDPDFLEAIALNEGSGNLNTCLDGKPTGGKGSPWVYGMMQISAAAAVDAKFDIANFKTGAGLVKELEYGYSRGRLSNPSSLSDPDINVRASAGYFKWLRDKYCGGDGTAYRKMAIGYHAGPSALSFVVSSIGPNTSTYVERVIRDLKIIKGAAFVDSDIDYTKPVSEQLGAKAKSGFRCKAAKDLVEPGMFPYPLPPNPFHATFSCQIGGIFNPDTRKLDGGFDLTPKRPQYITYFEYTERLGSETDSFRIRMFDPEWDSIEQEVLRKCNPDYIPVSVGSISVMRPDGAGVPFSRKENKNQVREKFIYSGFENMSLTWGYVSSDFTTGERTPVSFVSSPRMARLMGYQPTFVGWGVDLELTGLATDILSKLEGGEDSYIGGEYETPTDIARKIAERNNWPDPCLEQSKVVPGDDGKPKNWEKPSKMDDLTFLQTIVAPLAISAEDENRGGFMVNFDNEKKMLHFHSVPYNLPIIREYEYARNRTGAIISYKPEVNGIAMVNLGASTTIAQGYDTLNKEPITVEVDASVTKDAQVEGGVTTFRTEPTPDSLDHAIREEFGDKYFDSSLNSKEAVRIEATNYFTSLRKFAMTATLRIIGDPLIKPMRRIRIIVNSSRGVPHFVSGTWFIQEVKHIIKNGSYFCDLSLFRHGGESSSAGDMVTYGQYDKGIQNE
jgi:hypothetical protein